VAAWDQSGDLRILVTNETPRDAPGSVHFPGLKVQVAAFAWHPERYALTITTAEETGLVDLGRVGTPPPELIRQLIGDGPLKVLRILARRIGDTPAVAVAFSSKDGRCAWLHQDQTVTVRVTEKTFQQLSGLRAQTIEFDPSGRYLVAATEQGAELFDLDPGASGEPVRLERVVTGDEPLAQASFEEDGSRLFTISRSGVVRLTNVRRNLAPGATAGHTTPINTLVFRPSGKDLVSADEDGEVRDWDVPTGAARRMIPPIAKGWKKLVFSPDGKYMAGFGSDGRLRVWNAVGAEVPAPRAADGTTAPSFVEDIAFVSDRNDLRIVSRARVLTWELDNSSIRPVELNWPEDRPISLVGAFQSPNPNRCVLRGLNGWIGVLDGGRLIGTRTLESANWHADLQFLGPDRCLVPVQGRKVTLLDLPALTPVKTVSAVRTSGEFVRDLDLIAAVSPSGRFFLTRSAWTSHDPIEIWDREGVSMANRWDGAGDLVLAEFLNDDEILAVSRTGEVKRWSFRTGEVEVLPGHPDGISAAAVSPDRSLYAVAGQDRVVYVYPTSRAGLQKMCADLVPRAERLLAQPGR
jgi:WD40 repeat protein